LPPFAFAIFFPGKGKLVAGKQGRAGQKASAGKEFHPEIPRASAEEAGHRAPRPALLQGITRLLGREWLARPVSKMMRASWFLPGTPLLPAWQRLTFN